MAELAAEAHCAGHRGELALERTARAFAALAGRLDVREEDVLEAAELALAHRRRMTPPPPQEQKEPERNERSSSQEQEQSRRETDGDEQREHSHSQEQPFDTVPQFPPQANSSGAAGLGDVEQVFAIGDPFTIKPIRLRKDRVQRKGTGRRSRTATLQKAGRTVGSLPLVGSEMKYADIAWDATLRAVALRHRVGEGGWTRPVITLEDIRTRRREKKIGNLIVFSVDASGSMGAARRMEEAKGAVLSLLMDAYQKRDKVAFIAFRGQQAEVLLEPTGSVEQAYRRLEELPTGGRTPLASGLEESHRIIRNQLRKDPDTRPILLVLSDGRANAAPDGMKPMPAALEAARRIAARWPHSFLGDRCGAAKASSSLQWQRRFLKAWKPNICTLKNSRRIRWCVRSRIYCEPHSGMVRRSCFGDVFGDLGTRSGNRRYGFLGKKRPYSRSGSQSRVALRFRRRMYPDYGENRHARRNHGAHEDPKGTVSRSGETAKRRARLHAEFRSAR